MEANQERIEVSIVGPCYSRIADQDDHEHRHVMIEVEWSRGGYDAHRWIIEEQLSTRFSDSCPMQTWGVPTYGRVHTETELRELLRDASRLNKAFLACPIPPRDTADILAVCLGMLKAKMITLVAYTDHHSAPVVRYETGRASWAIDTAREAVSKLLKREMVAVA